MQELLAAEVQLHLGVGQEETNNRSYCCNDCSENNCVHDDLAGNGGFKDICENLAASAL